MNIEELENEYRIFCEKTQNDLGNIIPKSTINNQIKILSEKIPHKINTHDNTTKNKSIFSVTDIPELKKIRKRFLKNNDLYDETEKHNPSSSSLSQYLKFITNKIKKQEGKGSEMKTKNIILYGAPGVGKTHNYQRLISMIESGNSEKDIFDAITDNKSNERVELNNKKYQNIKNEKRVEFITFHQSYSYEDFIEGFRPNKTGNIELEDGIFKNIVAKALGKININSHLSIGREITSDRSSYIIDTVTADLINIKKEKDNKIVPIPKLLIVELIENIKLNIISLEDIKHRNLDNLDTNFDKYMYGYNSILHTICKSIVDEIEYNEKKNFYIVIDEINRGNISKIFGELITLIEEDKRDKYEVTLPYSKEPFKVPSNLYIIATMNSTDKSIATIDIALRRRFTFLKMKPNENLVEDINAKNLMQILNTFIKNNLGEDYMLGHSYFMGNNIDLEFIIEYKLKPLLEEYFYADDEKLKEILKLIESNND